MHTVVIFGTGYFRSVEMRHDQSAWDNGWTIHTFTFTMSTRKRSPDPTFPLTFPPLKNLKKENASESVAEELMEMKALSSFC